MCDCISLMGAEYFQGFAFRFFLGMHRVFGIRYSDTRKTGYSAGYQLDLF